ncbi:hypothetical protein IJJ08_00465 [bacterium]|nr:hypothetical protein [bacterium]
MSSVYGRKFLAAMMTLSWGLLAAITIDGRAAADRAISWWPQTHAGTKDQTMKLDSLSTGKLVQVDGLQFVKVSDNTFMAKGMCPEGTTWSSFYQACAGETTTYEYTGNYQTFTAPSDGYYVVELWGASGGNVNHATNTTGLGGYTRGEIRLNRGNNLYLYVGQEGPYNAASTNTRGGWNGGGFSGGNSSSDHSSGGGGATDVRLTSGSWNNSTSLRSRIMVAGGGAGSTNATNTVFGGHAGGLISSAFQGDFNSAPPLGATQTSGGQDGVANSTARNGSFGYAIQANTSGWGGGGGGGYYGGGNGYGQGGSGGSSYISGHTGCVAIRSTTSTLPKTGCETGSSDNTCSVHYSGKVFVNTKMIDGAGYLWTNSRNDLEAMPNPAGGYYASGVGHTGNGYARITFVATPNMSACPAGYSWISSLGQCAPDCGDNAYHTGANTCQCLDNYYADTNGSTTPTGTNGCNYKKCTGDHVAATYVGVSETCDCASGYYYNTSGATTTPNRLDTANPTNAYSCNYTTCPEGYYSNTSGNTYIAVGSTCNYQKCTGSHVSAYSTSGTTKCTCATGWGYGSSYASTTNTLAESCAYLKCGANSTNDVNNPAQCNCNSGYYTTSMTTSYTAVNGSCPVIQQSITTDTTTFSAPGVYTFTAQTGGTYRIELWGAQGGLGGYPTTSTNGGYGAYTAGTITLTAGTNLYFYLGGRGVDNTSGSKVTVTGGFNGGGAGGYDSGNYNAPGGSGGGATDVRMTKSTWNNVTSLRSRIMVAAGGGGGGALPGSDTSKYCGPGVAGGGIQNVYYIKRYGGMYTANVTQTTGYSFGTGYPGKTVSGEGYAGGGGGYYGGNHGGTGDQGGPAAGGSSYISGHTGCVAVTSASSSTAKSGCTTGTTNNACSTHYSGKVFTDTVMIDGAGFTWTNVRGYQEPMPNPSGGYYTRGTGHTGNGVAKITLITSSDTHTCDSGYHWSDSASACVLTCGANAYNSSNTACTCVSGFYADTSGSTSPGTGDCAYQKCTGSHVETYTNNATKCTCASGYYYNNAGATLTNVLNQSCNYVACPTGYYGNSSGAAYATATTACTYQKCTGERVAAYGNNGNCTCASGYAYGAAYATTTQTADESCSYLKCGANSSNDQDDLGTCVCDEGWYYYDPTSEELTTSYTAINGKCALRQDSVTASSADFDTPGAYTFTAASSGTYRLEVWGAQGGGGTNVATSPSHAGRGGYSYGEVTLGSSTTLYVFVGSRGISYNGGFNGGANGVSSNTSSYGGGGMTHISLQSNLATTTWNPNGTLIVAGAGGGADNAGGTYLGGDDGSGGFGGGSEGENAYVDGKQKANTAGTQISGYAQGVGGPPDLTSGANAYDRGAGGAGWYGGISANNGQGGGGGGSGWIYTATTYENWKTNGSGASNITWTVPDSYYLDNATTLAGDQEFPNPTGGSETGHTGDGFARITKIN